MEDFWSWPGNGKIEYFLGKRSGSAKGTEVPDLEDYSLFIVVKMCDVERKSKMKVYEDQAERRSSTTVSLCDVLMSLEFLQRMRCMQEGFKNR